jgi:hypothetical protein
MSYAGGRSVPHGQGEEARRSRAPNKGDAELLAGYAAKQRASSGKTPFTPEKTEEIRSLDKFQMLALVVEDQNTAIGRRNVHNLKTGYTYTIGGGNSDFLIFLVPMPPHIAELRFDGRQCTLIPKKPEFFPDTGSSPIPNCVGKTIRLVSEKNFELFIRVEPYENPLNSLNKLMNSVLFSEKTPGLP